MLPSLSFRSQRKLLDPQQLPHGWDASLVPFSTELHTGRALETTLGWVMPHHLYVCQSATSGRDDNSNSPLTWTGILDIRNVLHIVGKTKSRHVWVVSSGDTSHF